MARTPAARLAARTEPDTNGGCLLWTGYPVKGYGAIRVSGNKVYAHRLAWELVNGSIPDGICVLHRCDVPACVNPNHLFLGTHAENAADRAAKGRNRGGDRRGEKNSHAKLTAATVLVIRERLASGEHQRTIASSFGVSQQTVSKLKMGTRWAHIKDDN